MERGECEPTRRAGTRGGIERRHVTAEEAFASVREVWARRVLLQDALRKGAESGKLLLVSRRTWGCAMNEQITREEMMGRDAWRDLVNALRLAQVTLDRVTAHSESKRGSIKGTLDVMNAALRKAGVL